MPNITPLVTVRWIDFEGENSTSKFYLTTDDGATAAEIIAGAAALVGLLELATNASLSGYTVSFNEFATSSPPIKAGAYPNVEDRAMMNFSAQNGLSVRLGFPAPKDSVLTADAETINPVATPIANIINRWLAVTGQDFVVTDNEGTTLNNYGFGYRKRTHSRSERPGRYSAEG